MMKTLWLVIISALCMWVWFLLQKTKQNLYFKSLPTVSLVVPWRTGDLILSTSIYNVFLGKYMRYGHVAMIYQDPRNYLVYVWDLTFTNIPDMIWYRPFQASSRLIPISRYLEQNRRRFLVWRQLQVPNINVPKMTRAMQKVFETPCANTLFTWGIERTLSLFQRPLLPRMCQATPQHKHALNCALFIARTYQEYGLFKAPPTTYKLLPQDFSAETENLPWKESGVSWLGPEILIK